MVHSVYDSFPLLIQFVTHKQLDGSSQRQRRSPGVGAGTRAGPHACHASVTWALDPGS